MKQLFRFEGFIHEDGRAMRDETIIGWHYLSIYHVTICVYIYIYICVYIYIYICIYYFTSF